MNQRPPALVLGLSYACLPIARSLGRRGIQVFGIDNFKFKIGAWSRYLEYLDAPDDEDALLEYLIAFSKRLESKIVLFPLSDYYLSFLSNYRKSLRKYFYFPYSDDLDLINLVSKVISSRIYESLGIPIPKTLFLNKNALDEERLQGLRPPFVLKPAFHDSWLRSDEVKKKIGSVRKVLLAKDIYELQKLHAKLIGYDDLIIQDFIPGKTDSLFYYLGYRNARSQNVVSFVSKKLRTLPEGLGSETVSCSTRCETLTRLGEEVLAKLNYRGPAGIDFKFDVREQLFKVIEINFRIGLTDGLLVDCGIDLPFIYYLDAQDMDTEPSLDYARDVVWTWFERDVVWLKSYWRETNMSFFSWLKTYFTFRQSHASFSITDPGPFIYSLSTLLKRLFKNSF